MGIHYRLKYTFYFACLLLGLTVFVLPVHADKPFMLFTPDCLPRTTISINGHDLTVEVATQAYTGQGLMYRTELPWNHGMLFVFEPPRTTAMWMHNTYIPLSVTFLDESGVILNIEDMEPMSRELHYSQGMAAFAVEVNQGWFEQVVASPGDRFNNLPER
ncbi:DUF192 domain-containing protein [Desulfonatronovibrio magnus]|uniref:DUF192 domain-containing protein n=1 Tax=Desulfonatronovibrio magnus TaxID=698827 RepID=UPI0006969AC0|nr:DUF192 domain-containing protein [Desulfonatronovibrio magnus]